MNAAFTEAKTARSSAGGALQGNARILLLTTPLVLGALIWLYQSIWTWLFWSWGNDEYYGHGGFLPIISAYLIWQKRAELGVAWRERTGAGAPLLLLGGLSLQFVGALSGIGTIEAFSMPIVLLGIASFLGGKPIERLLRFPLLYLMMAVPLSLMLVQTLTVPLQNRAAGFAAIFLGLLGMPIERDGVNLYTPHYSFVVAVPCSGLKATITLLTLAVLVAHLLPRLSNAERFLLCLASVPIALFANSLRIILIVLIGHYAGKEAAEGFFHNFSGMVMFAIATGLLIGCGNLITRRRAAPAATAPEGTAPEAKAETISSAA